MFNEESKVNCQYSCGYFHLYQTGRVLQFFNLHIEPESHGKRELVSMLFRYLSAVLMKRQLHDGE